jgi:hypothetical protein
MFQLRAWTRNRLPQLTDPGLKIHQLALGINEHVLGLLILSLPWTTNPIKDHTTQDKKSAKKIMGTLGVEPRSLSLAYVQCGAAAAAASAPESNTIGHPKL